MQGPPESVNAERTGGERDLCAWSGELPPMIRTRVHMKLGRHTSLHKTLRVVDGLIAE